MQPTPLTPPNEYSAEAGNLEVGYLGTNAAITQLSIATPVSDVNMVLEEQDEMSSLGREEDQYMTDEDEDMSESGGGGAPLTMTLSRAEELNAELDELDADLMGPENLEDMYMEQHFSSHSYHYYNHQDQDPEDGYSDSPMDQLVPQQDTFPHGSGSLASLPSAMSQVSLHLQHLQEEQEHAEEAGAIDEDVHVATLNNIDEPFNLSVGDFFYAWGTSAVANQGSRRRPQGPDLKSLAKQRAQKLPIMQIVDLEGEECDMQRINWSELGVSRLEARQMRRSTYKNYQNLRTTERWHPRINGAKLADDQNFFRFRRMDFDHSVNLSHFQLRNLLSCAYRDHVFYAGRSKIMQWQPGSGATSGPLSVAMDLTNPVVQSFYSHHRGIQISTLTVGHDVLVAGGFNGEYALVNLRASKEAKHTEGLLTDHVNSITNFIQVNLSRSSSSPLAAFASNDMGLRILDVNTNKFIAEHKYEHAINCSAMSTDRRLRVLVGDTKNVMICNADTGEVLQSLDGHRDYGFGCDWADDGWTVATGNQDMQIKIWDARKWTDTQGRGQPLATIAAEMAGVRKLKFSPIGSGKRVLLAAEPADIVSVIDADSFTSKQNLNFFGEVGGVDFTNGGRDLLIANCDAMRGGIMEYERCNLAGRDYWGMQGAYGNDKSRCRRPRAGYDWASDDDVLEHPRAQGTKRQRAREAASLASLPHF